MWPLFWKLLEPEFLDFNFRGFFLGGGRGLWFGPNPQSTLDKKNSWNRAFNTSDGCTGIINVIVISKTLKFLDESSWMTHGVFMVGIRVPWNLLSIETINGMDLGHF